MDEIADVLEDAKEMHDMMDEQTDMINVWQHFH